MISADFSDFTAFADLLAAEAVEARTRVEKLAIVPEQMVILARARADAPERTGALKRDIRPIGRSGMTRRVRAGKKKTFYTRFQEKGTRKMRAHPFLLKQVNPSSQAEFANRVRSAINLGRIYR